MAASAINAVAPFRHDKVGVVAKPARMRFRHWVMVLSFLVMVVGPVAAVGVYLYNYAADQYVSKVGFSVRKEEGGAAFDILGSLSTFSGSSSTDTDILYKFIQSQELIETAERKLDLSRIYQKAENDPVFSLKSNATIEDLIDYWAAMVRIYYEPGTGLIEIETRSFDPQDSRKIATFILEQSSEMINQLSTVARNDTINYAREDLEQAEGRLRAAESALTMFRNETQIVDPVADIQGRMGLLNSLQAQLAAALIELDLLMLTTREGDPRIERESRKVTAITNRIGEERQKLGVDDGQNDNAFANLTSKFERLQMDRNFAQKAYVLSLSAYDKSVAEARRQSRYLAAYEKPTLAQSPQHPQRKTLLGVTFVLIFGIWAIFILVYYSLKDRR